MRSVAMLRLLQLLALICAALPTWSQDHPFYLHKEDRVVFYGDSITAQGRYTAFLETYVATHFPELNVRFTNSGWRGDWISGGEGGKVDVRLARDVIANKPTVVTLMLGMNDAAYQDFDTTSFTVYSKGYVHLVEGLRQTIPSLRITLLQPSPFDDVTRAPQYALRDGGYNNVIVRYGQFVRDLAQKENLDVIDVNATLVAVLKRADLSDHALAEKIVPDRIHPSTAGALVIASAILGAWNATAVVSSVEIDAFRARVQHQVNANVTSIQTKPTVSWTQRDSALPLPLNPKDDVLALVLRSSTIVESLDQQLLKVTGLRAAKYSLSIDGKKIGTWTRENLAHGVNLALLETPMLKQALRVYALSRRRNSVRMARWQSVQVALQGESSPHIRQALAALDAMENELILQQKTFSVSKVHRYELVPQGSK